MLDTSGNFNPSNEPCFFFFFFFFSLLTRLFIHSFLPVSLIQQYRQQVRSLGPPGEMQIPEEEWNNALSLYLSVCVRAVTGRWAVLQSLLNKLIHTLAHTQGKQTMPIKLCEHRQQRLTILSEVAQGLCSCECAEAWKLLHTLEQVQGLQL